MTARPEAADPAAEQTSELGAGGVVLATLGSITTEREEVVLSSDKVRITYIFRNVDAKARTLPMAFALPEIDMAALDGATVNLPAFDVTNPTNYVGFWAVIDGAPVQPEVEQRALALGLFDVTAQLTNLDLPIFPLSGDMRQRLAALPAATRTELSAKGVVNIGEDHVDPLWTLRTAYQWPVAFPPGQAITVSLGYQPVTGTVTWSTDASASLARRFCVDKAAVQLLDKRAASGKPAVATILTYSATVGAALRGTVLSARLAIERQTDATIVATCRADLKPVGPRLLEASQSDVVADEDVHVLFVEP